MSVLTVEKVLIRMDRKIGFIGCGNMGRAMLDSLLNNHFIKKDNVRVSVKTDASRKEIAQKWAIETSKDNAEIVRHSDIIFLAVNPKDYQPVIQEIRDITRDDQIFISIAAGIDLFQLENWFGNKTKIVKTMPNTPVMVNAGMSAICPNEYVSKDELDQVCSLFSLFGEYEMMEEEDFDAFIALCGSSPAYIFVLIEAMADAAVKLGLPRKSAYRMAEQAILGSAKLALETGSHPAELKDMVCSPGGSTIVAVAELETQGFRAAIMKAMEKCAEKSKNMHANMD